MTVVLDLPAPAHTDGGHDFDAAPHARVHEALVEGGYMVASVRSKKSGQHVSLVLAAKAARDGGGYVSRSTKAGRVGLDGAAVVYFDRPDGEYVGKLDLLTGEFRFARAASDAERWTAQKLVAYAKGNYPALDTLADVFLARQCSVCHRRLEHPESIAAGIGPECAGRRNRGRHVAR